MIEEAEFSLGSPYGSDAHRARIRLAGIARATEQRARSIDGTFAGSVEAAPRLAWRLLQEALRVQNEELLDRALRAGGWFKSF